MPDFIINQLRYEKNYNIIFDNISCDLSNGDTLKISGRNGSGKTSLLKIIAGVSSCENSQIYYKNYQVNSKYYKKNICYIGHLNNIDNNLKCKENLLYLAQIKKLKNVNIEETLAKVGLDNYKNEYTKNLSAGQKRLILMAFVFINQAPILLLDEPFTALDKNSVLIIENAIKNHTKNGGICIFTTHQKCNLVATKNIYL